MLVVSTGSVRRPIFLLCQFVNLTKHYSPFKLSIMMTSKYTAFRCPDDLLAKAKFKASKDRRSLSNYLITLVEKDVADEPTPPKAKAKKR